MSSLTDFLIGKVDPSDLTTLESIYRLRAQTRAEWLDLKPDAFPDGRWTDHHDANAFHFAAFDGDEVIACARLTIHERIDDFPDPEFWVDIDDSFLAFPVGSINRLSVNKNYRGFGLARKLDETRLVEALQHGAKCVVGGVVESHLSRIKALNGYGFEILGIGSGGGRSQQETSSSSLFVDRDVLRGTPYPTIVGEYSFIKLIKYIDQSYS